MYLSHHVKKLSYISALMARFESVFGTNSVKMIKNGAKLVLSFVVPYIINPRVVHK